MNLFKQIRLKLKLTQNEMAEKLEVDQTAISNYELNKRWPSKEIFIRYIEIANELGLNPSASNLRASSNGDCEAA